MSGIQLVTMYDAIHDDAHNIPLSAVKVAGYVTGTPDIQWSAADWDRFPAAGKVRVDQSPEGHVYAAGLADCYDIETRGGTPASFAAAAAARHARKEGNCAYASRSNLAAAAAELDNAPADKAWWRGGFDAWLADPDLNQQEAAALIGTTLDGFVVRAVQWAWPSTNPATPVPGGTLKSLNLDLSVADAGWFAARPIPPTWQAQALQLATDINNRGAQLTALLKAHS